MREEYTRQTGLVVSAQVGHNPLSPRRGVLIEVQVGKEQQAAVQRSTGSHLYVTTVVSAVETRVGGDTALRGSLVAIRMDDGVALL